jgi:hypothetical protein
VVEHFAALQCRVDEKSELRLDPALPDEVFEASWPEALLVVGF